MLNHNSNLINNSTFKSKKNVLIVIIILIVILIVKLINDKCEN